MKFLLALTKRLLNDSIQIKKMLPVLFILGILSGTTLFSGETGIVTCKLPHCKVRCMCPQEADIACTAVKRAMTFFKSYGYDISPSIDIEFVKKTPDDGRKSGKITAPFFCQYNRKNKRIRISSWTNKASRERKAFGSFPLDKEFFTSMVAHEVGHLLFDSILESRDDKTGHSFHEFIANVVQIETMGEPHKSKVISLWGNDKLPSLYAINPFFWMMDPDRFAVLSHRLFKSYPEIVRHILDGKVKPFEIHFILDY